jgi:hypothetical protein
MLTVKDDSTQNWCSEPPGLRSVAKRFSRRGFYQEGRFQMVAEHVGVTLCYGLGSQITSLLRRDEVIGASSLQLLERLAAGLDPVTPEAITAKVLRRAMLKPGTEIVVTPGADAADEPRVIVGAERPVITDAGDSRRPLKEIHMVVSEDYQGGDSAEGCRNA